MKVNIGNVPSSIVNCNVEDIASFLSEYKICNIHKMWELNSCLYDLSGVDAYNMGKYAKINKDHEYFQLNINDVKLSKSFNATDMWQVINKDTIKKEITNMCLDGFIFRYLKQADKNYRKLWHYAKQIDYRFEWGAHTITTDYFHKDLVEALVKIPIEDSNIKALAKEIYKIESLKEYVRIK